MPNIKSRPVYTLFVFLTCFFAPLLGNAQNIVVESAWTLPLPPVSVNGAAYLTVVNSGMADRLVAAESAISERVELHRHVSQDGQMSMEKMDLVEIPMHSSVEFAPGHMHIMLLGLQEPLVEGDHFPLKLVFEKAGEMEVMVKISVDGAHSGGDSSHSNHSTGAE